MRAEIAAIEEQQRQADRASHQRRQRGARRAHEKKCRQASERLSTGQASPERHHSNIAGPKATAGSSNRNARFTKDSDATAHQASIEARRRARRTSRAICKAARQVRCRARRVIRTAPTGGGRRSTHYPSNRRPRVRPIGPTSPQSAALPAASPRQDLRAAGLPRAVAERPGPDPIRSERRRFRLWRASARRRLGWSELVAAAVRQAGGGATALRCGAGQVPVAGDRCPATPRARRPAANAGGGTDGGTGPARDPAGGGRQVRQVRRRDNCWRWRDGCRRWDDTLARGAPDAAVVLRALAADGRGRRWDDAAAVRRCGGGSAAAVGRLPAAGRAAAVGLPGGGGCGRSAAESARRRRDRASAAALGGRRRRSVDGTWRRHR